MPARSARACRERRRRSRIVWSPRSTGIIGRGSRALAAPPARSLGVDSLEIDGATVTASVSALGGVAAEVVIEFDAVSGLSESSLGLSVQTVDPTSLALLARLPSGASVPTAFPLQVSIEPPAAGGLSFEGTFDLEIHTANLEYLSGTSLRLFAAQSGGACAS